jgi:hypothetical protein
MPSAVNVSIPRNARNRETIDHSSSDCDPREALRERVATRDQPVDGSERVEVDEIEI